MAMSWFDAREAEAFGVTLAKFFSDRVPPDATDDSKKSSARHQQAVQGMLQLRDHFKTHHKLNIYKKAKLANAFKWTLREAGYDDALIDRLTMDVTVQL
ncbi:hypothetical protein [Arenimonas oryziterrae]|uniref:Uncharacterized protein n=1 Tax=Arenimonas oryziterrae DSM 21050 = YC6267 TaxID=1121015 RepID=A0A091BG74_9GAMM|nr:hypothetical protein [Arenimonas oryziterrae]KFN43365.1 hypothetical protein N789_08810 [Arenimonas oryziterrae DSM 21050 = YC6267]